ncbi:MAG: RpiB/LacA/LacB family sugar-phosphate isomerase [Limisphaerales bacterium]|jgi:RpiB/LacA/LacB family sugar-phosphate isomerase
MAEGLFRQETLGNPAFEAASAGVGAMNGSPPSIHAVVACKEKGIDITHQRSNQLTVEMVREADYIFGMTRGHVDAITMLYPQAAEKTFLMREFEEDLEFFEKDIADPIGGSVDIYRLCCEQIEEGINSALDFMQGGESGACVTSIAIGSDHGGFALKQGIRELLLEHGIEVADFGTDSKESTDYPDYARPVAEAVTSGRIDAGILICSTGVGMSITANKIPGIRAALVFNEDMAVLAREHNDANVLCLGQNQTDLETAKAIVTKFLETPFESGGRHERRVGKMENESGSLSQIAKIDPAIAEAIEQERQRQQENIELIASENFTTLAVMEAQGSVLTNKYAEGYPGKRWYGGCEHVDTVEELAIDRAKQLFGVDFANVQPHSGSSANMAVYFAMLQNGAKMLTMDLNHGGHLTHGNKANFSGKFFDIVHYGVRKGDERIDYDQLAEMAREHRPAMITVGASAYPREIDFKRMGEIAREVGALLLADIAHIAGLVAAGQHPSPVGHADFITTTTHKTLRGPRGGLILTNNEDYAKKVNSFVFPGIQGGPLMHVIAAKAVCFHQALQPEFKTYQEQIVKNAKAMADGVMRNGFRLCSGGTDNHLMLVDVGAKGLTGKECQLALDEAAITTNKNTIPFETRSPFQASGIRLGSPAVTARGMKEAEMAAIADMISEVLLDINNVDTKQQVRQRVRELTAQFPLPY